MVRFSKTLHRYFEEEIISFKATLVIQTKVVLNGCISVILFIRSIGVQYFNFVGLLVILETTTNLFILNGNIIFLHFHIRLKKLNTRPFNTFIADSIEDIFCSTKSNF